MAKSKNHTDVSMEKIANLSKRRGFVFPSSEIYGGLGSVWDYGSLGVELKNNIKREWWKAMVQENNDILGLDSAILMHPKTWEASGHVESFVDPLVDCLMCRERFRADHLLEEKKGREIVEEEGIPINIKELERGLAEVSCPKCGGVLTKPRKFNLLMETYLGVVEDKKNKIYLRGETCQGIYLEYLNVLASSRRKIPFGIAQIGKAFRNEITPGNFIFRMREFEQMEMQFFVNSKEAAKHYKAWKERRLKWYLDLGMKKANVRFREHTKDERAFYALAAWDIEYKTPFGWKEMEGIHNRGDWDLSRHGEYSGKDMSYFDEETKKKFIPYIIETSAGADRALLMFMLDAYNEERVRGETRVVLKFDKRLAPYKIAILPLSKDEKLDKEAKKIFEMLSDIYMCEYDDTGSIGKRYRRQDEIGTPHCVTFDFDSLKDKKVTVRDRDTMKQDRIAVENLKNYFLRDANMPAR